MSAEPRPVTLNEIAAFRQSLMMRSAITDYIIDLRSNIDYDCGYPKVITAQMYKAMYEREPVAHRVVTLVPDEVWAIPPEVYEKEGDDNTPWEMKFNSLVRRLKLWHYLHRVDVESGIGEYGVLFHGFNDGKPYDEPVQGINPLTGAPSGHPRAGADVLFLRVFDQTQVQISEIEDDTASPRCGHPRFYNLSFANPTGPTTSVNIQRVHWSRVTHIADERTTSDVFGTPRQKNVYNRLIDVRKVSSGSGEMFYKGARPGLAFEVNPEFAPEVELDKDSIKKEMKRFTEGLQPYLAVEGVVVKSLPVKVADPTAHIDIQLKLIAMAKEVPYRILLGSEEAHISSTMDGLIWNKRIKRKQYTYTFPWVIDPVVQLYMATGVLPKIDPKYWWGDLNMMTDEQRADNAVKMMTALVQYVSGRVENVIAPEQVLTDLMGIDLERAQSIIALAEKHLAATNGDGLTGLKSQLQALVGPPNASGQPPPKKPKRGKKDIQTTGAGGV